MTPSARRRSIALCSIARRSRKTSSACCAESRGPARSRRPAWPTGGRRCRRASIAAGQRDPVAARRELRIGGEVARVGHQPGGDAGGLQGLHHRLGGALARPRLDQPIERGGVARGGPPRSRSAASLAHAGAPIAAAKRRHSASSVTAIAHQRSRPVGVVAAPIHAVGRRAAVAASGCRARPATRRRAARPRAAARCIAASTSSWARSMVRPCPLRSRSPERRQRGQRRAVAAHHVGVRKAPSGRCAARMAHVPGEAGLRLQRRAVADRVGERAAGAEVRTG